MRVPAVRRSLQGQHRLSEQARDHLEQDERGRQRSGFGDLRRWPR